MKLNIEDMISGDVTRIRYVVRFPNCRRTHPESVAEHSYFTALFAMLIGRTLAVSEATIGLILQKALIHDVEEAISADLPRPFKYSSPELKAAMDMAAGLAFKQATHNLIENEEGLKLEELWHNAKGGGVAGKIVAFADFLSVLSYLVLEAETGNKTIKRHVKELEEYANKFLDPEYGFLREYFNQAYEILKRIML